MDKYKSKDAVIEPVIIPILLMINNRDYRYNIE